MFNRIAYENSRPDGIGVLEIVNGSGEDQPRRFVPLRRTELKGEIAGPVAAFRQTQVYGYSREQCDKVLEALYRFPLPGDAAVTGVRVRFGDVEVLAELKGRETAEADYEEARKQGRQAALATRESPDVFTLQVAGIQPDQEVTVETSYVQLARPEGSGWSLRIPLTTAPRYVRSDERTSRHAQGQPLLLLRDPGHRFLLDVTLHGAGTVESPTHRLDVTEEGGRLRVGLQGGEVLPDRDLVLSWQPRQEQDRPALQILLHEDPVSAQTYFLALVVPPAVHDSGRAVPREVILLVDHSGSMEGAKWEAADWVVKRFLSDLTGRDAFNVGLFHDTTRWFSDRPRRADTDTVQEAVKFLEGHRDSGGTELGVALEQALSQDKTGGEYARHVLIVTDAQVSDEGRILRLTGQEAGQADRRRISLLCIDAAPNSFLALTLAERGGGVARFLTSAPEEEDITTALDSVLGDWAEPALSGLRLEVSHPAVQAAGHEVSRAGRPGWSAVDLRDLPAGRSLWVAGRIPNQDALDLTFRLTARNHEVAAYRLELPRKEALSPSLKPLFGARRVLGLEFLISSGYDRDALSGQLKLLGYDPEEVLTDQAGKPSRVYAENTREDAKKALRKLLVQEALDYGLACSETAFVAVRKEAGQVVEGSVAVANALPAGWSEDFLAGAGLTYGRASLSYVRSSAIEAVEASAPGMSLRSVFASLFSSRAGTRGRRMRPKVAFSGLPQFEGGEAILFDSTRRKDAKKLPEEARLSRLTVHFPDGTPECGNLDAGLSLLIFVGDLASPCARVRLVDLIRQGLERPLNLLRRSGQVVRIVLVDPKQVWLNSPLKIEIALQCDPGVI